MEQQNNTRRRRTLFGRLFLYFFIVLSIPLLLFGAYYLAFGNTRQNRYIAEQVKEVITLESEKVAQVLESYRHKAYLLSTHPEIVSIVAEDFLEPETQTSRRLYQLLFDVMKGDTYLASANVVSNSGKIRLSTHTFPDVYDLRYHGNEWDMNSVIVQHADLSPTASIISIRSHRRADNGRQVIASILRRIYDEEYTNLGYLIIDIYAEALSSQINTEGILTDVLLFDTTSFYATSLLNPERFGTFDRFPPLLGLQGDYTHRSFTSGANLVGINPVSGTTLALAGTISGEPVRESINQILLIFAAMMGVGMLVATGLSLIFSRSISRPIKSLATRMSTVEAGQFASHHIDSSIREFAQLEDSFNTMVVQIEELLEQTREEQRKLSDAERKALESQMNPHFLFNTLNTIKALARLNDQEEIYTISVKLGKLLRSTIDNHQSESTLAESMALIDSYLTIQKLRFGEKLVAELYLDPRIAEVQTPKLIIQPLVENAIIHGLEPKLGAWHISVRVASEDGRVHITVADNGVGFPAGTLPDDLDELANSGHVGVYNVYRRLYLTYGSDLSFSLDSTVGVGTVVKISFPIDPKQRSSA
ncbi:MAG TPA: sensor histidine kinase [Sphaerochaeta sp.]|nr:sensor histidine kinase [Sphaerochaeta sp.]